MWDKRRFKELVMTTSRRDVIAIWYDAMKVVAGTNIRRS